MGETATLPDPQTIAAEHGDALLGIVGRTIDSGLAKGKPPQVALQSFAPALRAPGASFVTIEKAGALRGCIGSLQAHRPLIEDLVQNAFSAAFKDPRFPPVSAEERPTLAWSISLLSQPEEIAGLKDEADLLARLEPGADGVILAEGARRATFLPQVWEQIPDPRDFIGRLKLKAGLSPVHWSAEMRVWRYGVVKIG